jgi:hypothetical protein
VGLTRRSRPPGCGRARSREQAAGRASPRRTEARCEGSARTRNRAPATVAGVIARNVRWDQARACSRQGWRRSGRRSGIPSPPAPRRRAARRGQRARSAGNVGGPCRDGRADAVRTSTGWSNHRKVIAERVLAHRGGHQFLHGALARRASRAHRSRVRTPRSILHERSLRAPSLSASRQRRSRSLPSGGDRRPRPRATQVGP